MQVDYQNIYILVLDMASMKTKLQQNYDSKVLLASNQCIQYNVTNHT